MSGLRLACDNVYTYGRVCGCADRKGVCVAIQMELACRGYMDDPAEPPTSDAWPAAYRPDQAAPMRAALTDVLKACLAFAQA